MSQAAKSGKINNKQQKWTQMRITYVNKSLPTFSLIILGFITLKTSYIQRIPKLINSINIKILDKKCFQTVNI